MSQFSGKTALGTGALGTIGQALLARFALEGAMFGLVEAMARELGHHGINVNGICPGAVLSDAEFRHFGDKAAAYDSWILENQSLKQRILPQDIANLAVFLSSRQADLITGQNIHCDGGW